MRQANAVPSRVGRAPLPALFLLAVAGQGYPSRPLHIPLRPMRCGSLKELFDSVMVFL